ncbi:MAG: phytoene/squalene synthase family protein [Elusimicrobiota bacterium]
MNKKAANLDLILKKVSRTLYLSLAILPEEIRRQLSAGYLICRAMDSVVDSVDIKVEEKKRLLSCFDLSLDGEQAFLSKGLQAAAEKLSDRWEKELLAVFPHILYLVSYFSDEEKKLLKTLIKGVRKGMETDLNVFGEPSHLVALKTEKDLIQYCRQIGGVPGIFWHGVYNSYLRGKLGDPLVRNSAYQIGTALQLTNIIKDVHEDLLKGRCYFPQEDLVSMGLNPDDLLNKDKFGAFRPVLNRWILQAVDLLDTCENFLFSISKAQFSMRAAVIWPVYWAMDSLHETAISNPLSGKVKIGRKKIYSTLIRTPSLLVADSVFQRGYRFRRETLITSMAWNL